MMRKTQVGVPRRGQRWPGRLNVHSKCLCPGLVGKQDETLDSSQAHLDKWNLTRWKTMPLTPQACVESQNGPGAVLGERVVGQDDKNSRRHSGDSVTWWMRQSKGNEGTKATKATSKVSLRFCCCCCTCDSDFIVLFLGFMLSFDCLRLISNFVFEILLLGSDTPPYTITLWNIGWRICTHVHTYLAATQIKAQNMPTARSRVFIFKWELLNQITIWNPSIPFCITQEKKS